MARNIVDYRMDKDGGVFARCHCGNEYRLTAREIRSLIQSRPDLVLRNGTA